MQNNSKEKRISSPHHNIDAGFINRRKCLSVFGRAYVKEYEALRFQGEDHMSVLMNDHLLILLAIENCKIHEIPSLSECLSNLTENQLFCSTEEVIGCGDSVYNETRVFNKIQFSFETEYEVFIEYHTEHIYASTQKMLMSRGHKMSIVGEIFQIDDNKIVVHPLIMGSPTYDHPANKELPFKYTFDGWTQYEIFASDIDQFELCKDIKMSADEWLKIMKNLSEEKIKEGFCRLLDDSTSKDWGGEQYDHFTSDIHFNGMRKSAAFLFKGPSSWGEMKPKHLGKNGDQIYRLNQSEADILIVQHCHNIGEAVRSTLRAFAVTPNKPRHYCLIDGKETYRIFKAYGLI